MADQNDVRRIALALPHTSEASGHFGFSVANKGKHKQFAWTWNERVEPKRPRIPRPDVLVLRVSDLLDKDALIASDGHKFFTEPHYNDFPAVLVRLEPIALPELQQLILDAWRTQAPNHLSNSFQPEAT
jgi:hypothetical protein